MTDSSALGLMQQCDEIEIENKNLTGTLQGRRSENIYDEAMQVSFCFGARGDVESACQRARPGRIVCYKLQRQFRYRLFADAPPVPASKDPSRSMTLKRTILTIHPSERLSGVALT